MLRMVRSMNCRSINLNCGTVSIRGIYKCLLLASLALLPSLTFALPQLVFNTTGQPPLNTNKQNGFMDEVAREALRRAGFELVINRLPAERGLRNINNGLIDGEMSRVKGIDQTYQNLVRVPEKIMDWEFLLFSTKQINVEKGWASLANESVAYITGWKIVEKNVPQTASITKTRNSQQLFTLLKKERADFVVYERWAGGYLINQLNISNVQPLRPALAKKEMYIYLHKKHKSAVPKITEALVEMKRDGSYGKLVAKHLKTISRKAR